jgi:hypothetical protein
VLVDAYLEEIARGYGLSWKPYSPPPPTEKLEGDVPTVEDLGDTTTGAVEEV